MRFKAPGNEPVFLSLTSGNTAVVGVDYTELEPMFHREAIAAGCLPFGVEAPAPVVAEPTFDRKKVITDAINAMLDGAEEGDFTGDGKPDVKKLSARVGFTVDRKERDALFAEVTK